MGYTHFWRPTKGIEPTTFARLSRQAAEVVSLILSETDNLELAFEYDEPEREPVFTEELIRFNGVGDEGLETFVITPGGSDFEFCKTARKPYDTAVVAVLCLLHHHTEIEVSSDGEPEDWERGLEFARRLEPKCQLPPRIGPY